MVLFAYQMQWHSRVSCQNGTSQTFYLAIPMHRRHHAISLQDAVNASETLFLLSKRIALSQACFKAVVASIPIGLRAAIAPGPIEQTAENTEWCLLVPSSAAASKLRQMLPNMLVCLEKAGLRVSTIRLKVQQARSANLGAIEP
jgi:hypothetical protein